MTLDNPLNIDLAALPSPAYVLDEALLRRNCERLQAVKHATGCGIILALKGFAVAETFPLIRESRELRAREDVVRMLVALVTAPAAT